MIPKQTLTLTQLVPAEPLTSAEARIAPQITREPLIRWGVMSEAVIRLTATLLLTVFALAPMSTGVLIPRGSRCCCL